MPTRRSTRRAARRRARSRRRCAAPAIDAHLQLATSRAPARRPRSSPRASALPVALDPRPAGGRRRRVVGPDARPRSRSGIPAGFARRRAGGTGWERRRDATRRWARASSRRCADIAARTRTSRCSSSPTAGAIRARPAACGGRDAERLAAASGNCDVDGSPSRAAADAADRLSRVEDYTNKYKGEQVEVALFGGEYQDGVLTAYCYVEDVAHIELNGHILIPLQNIASLHCSSRCDAPEPDWPPRGSPRTSRTSATTTRRPAPCGSRRGRAEPPQGLAVFVVPAAALGFVGWKLGGYRLALLFVGSVVLLGAAIYWYADRIAMGMVGARELLPGEAPALHATVERLAGARRRDPAAALRHPRRVPARALGRTRRARRSALAVSSGCWASRRRPSSRAWSRTSSRTPAPRRARADDRRPSSRRRSSRRPASAAGSSARSSSCSGPLAASFVHLLLSPKREYEADRFAARALRLAARARRRAAASRAGDGARLVPGQPGDGAALHDNPFADEGLAALFVTHPPLGRARAAGCGSSTRSGARSCAPPELERRGTQRAPRRGLVVEENGRRPTLPGDCSPSTIGASGLNFSVRNGKRCFPAAMTAQLVRRRPEREWRSPSKLHSSFSEF